MKKKLYSILSLVLIAFLMSGCYVNDFSDIDENTEQNSESENTEINVEEEVKQLQQRIEVFDSEITPLAQKCDSASQMLAYIDQIKAMPQVKDAWVENEVFCLKDESGMLHVWDYQTTDIVTNEDMEAEAREIKASLETRSLIEADKSVGQDKRVCILLSDDDKGLRSSLFGNILGTLFESYGFEVKIVCEGEFTPDFLWNDDFLNYDFYYILTHGDYANGRHWLKTNADASALIIFLMNKMGIKVKYGDLGYHYKRSGEIWSGRFMVSENFFEDYVFDNRTFKRQNPIVFSAACLSMAKNNNLAKIFVDKGKAGAFLGFSTSQVHGRFAGIELYRLMLDNHYTLGGALNAMKNRIVAYETEDAIDDYKYIEKRKYYYYETLLDADLEYLGTNSLSINPPKTVDMGGKVKWATFNIGAITDNELGDSIRWGEIHPKYQWLYGVDNDNYDYSKRYDTTHYNHDYEYDYQINDIGSNEEHDAATAYLGKGWRLPTKEDFEDLLYSGKNEIERIMVTDPHYLIITNKSSGNQIMLPYPGFSGSFSSFVSIYWTSNVYKENDEKEAWGMLPIGIPPFYDTLMSDCPGYYAGYVRPVYEGR